mgnify:FL=1
MKNIIRIATRNSPLALEQAKMVSTMLSKENEVKIISMTSSGDKVTPKEFKIHGGKGLFLKELEESLLHGDTDIAVHSLKDVPADLEKRFSIMTVSTRENPCDAFISKKYKRLKDLLRDAKIGTSSPRRIAMLKNISNDFRIIEIRGNIQTRLRKMGEQNIDGIILAAAGLHRMKLEKYIAEYIPADSFIPSAGQGIICIEYLKKNIKIQKLLNKYNIVEVEKCANEERSFVREIGGDCMSPIGAHATIKNNKMKIDAYVSELSGDKHIRSSYVVDMKKSIGHAGSYMAKIFIKQGAKKLLRIKKK